MSIGRYLCSGLLVLMLAKGAWAAIEAHTFDKPEREQAYQALIEELRCLVCQNQNLAESNAELAGDLRQEVYRMLKEGRSREEIVNFMVSRYGDFVLYRPPVRSYTLLLWFGPALLLLLGAGILFWALRQRQQANAPPTEAADPDSMRRAHELLSEDNQERSA